MLLLTSQFYKDSFSSGFIIDEKTKKKLKYAFENNIKNNIKNNNKHNNKNNNNNNDNDNGNGKLDYINDFIDNGDLDSLKYLTNKFNNGIILK